MGGEVQVRKRTEGLLQTSLELSNMGFIVASSYIKFDRSHQKCFRGNIFLRNVSPFPLLGWQRKVPQNLDIQDHWKIP